MLRADPDDTSPACRSVEALCNLKLFPGDARERRRTTTSPELESVLTVDEF